MLRKSRDDLRFARSSQPLPTIEVNLDIADDLHPGAYLTTVAALSSCAEDNPDLIATVYTYEALSVNFHDRCWSVFYIVAGGGLVLDAIYKGFSLHQDAKVRYSDHIQPRDGVLAYHIEGGRLWELEDEQFWFSKSTEEISVEIGEIGRLIAAGRESVNEDDVEPACPESPDSIADVVQGREWGEQPARFRRARSDASVGTIRRQIEKIFGLPEGSVALCGPDRSPLKANAKISTLRRRWE